MTAPSEAQRVRDLYRSLLDAWNSRDALGMAALISEDGNVVGFDGSQMKGREDVAATLGVIFANHPTARYVAVVREVRFLSVDLAILSAVVGMVPPGSTDINPAVNAVQTLVLARTDDEWLIELFQNTPAGYHGRPEKSAALTEELRRALTG